MDDVGPLEKRDCQGAEGPATALCEAGSRMPQAPACPEEHIVRKDTRMMKCCYRLGLNCCWTLHQGQIIHLPASTRVSCMWQGVTWADGDRHCTLLRPPFPGLAAQGFGVLFSRETQQQAEKLLESLKIWMSANGSHHTGSPCPIRDGS